MNAQLTVTKDIVRCMIALEDNEDFKQLMQIMNDRAEGMALWMAMMRDPLDLHWAQGRVQEMSNWIAAWVHRRDWRETLQRQDDGDKIRGMESEL